MHFRSVECIQFPRAHVVLAVGAFEKLHRLVDRWAGQPERASPDPARDAQPPEPGRRTLTESEPALEQHADDGEVGEPGRRARTEVTEAASQMFEGAPQREQLVSHLTRSLSSLRPELDRTVELIAGPAPAELARLVRSEPAIAAPSLPARSVSERSLETFMPASGGRLVSALSSPQRSSDRPAGPFDSIVGALAGSSSIDAQTRPMPTASIRGIVRGAGPSLRDAVAAMDLDAEHEPANEIPDARDVPASLSIRTAGTSQLEPIATTTARATAAPTRTVATSDATEMAARDAAPIEQRVEAAREQIGEAQRRGEEPGLIVQREEARMAGAEGQATDGVRGETHRHRAAQVRRRQRAAQRGGRARGAAQRGATRRRGQARRRQTRNVATVRAELARYREQQLQRMEQLRQTERQRITQQMQALFEAERRAAAQERQAAIQLVAEQLRALMAEIEQGRVLAEQTRVQREQALALAHDALVQQARTAQQQHAQNLAALGEQGARGFRATGAHEAQQARARAQGEAARIEARGRAAAARAQQVQVAAGATPEERRAVIARGRARARQLVAEHAAQARARIARGNAEAERTIAAHEARAVALLERTRRDIETARRETTQRLELLRHGLAVARQRLVAERDLWIQQLELQARAFQVRAVREVMQLNASFDAQRQVAERQHRERFQAAIRALENDVARMRAEVQRNVLARIDALRQRLATGTHAELAAIDRDFAAARTEVDRQVARISERANQEVAAFERTSAQRTQAIRTRGNQARAQIRRMADTAHGAIATTNQNAQRTLGRPGEFAVRRDNQAWAAIDRENAERYRVQDDESYRLRRYARTGEEEITSENAEGTRLTLLGANRGINNPSAVFSTLGTRTPEELRILFADQRFRDEFMSGLRGHDRRVVEQMLAARNPERIRALALQWAADGGYTGLGTDDDVMRRVFAASTNDAERAQVNREFQAVDARARSMAVGVNVPGRSIDDMLRDENRWSTTARIDLEQMRAHQRGNETEIAAWDTIAAYQGGGSFGLGSDDDRVLQIRNDIRRRYAGPFRSPAEAEQARRDEAEALARIDTISRNATGRALRDLDAGETSGPTAQALEASTQTVEEPIDPRNPAGPRRTQFRPDWTQFRARVAESGVGSDYNTRRVELAFGDSTPDERIAINAQFARNQNGVTFEQYVQRNMGVTRHYTRDGRTVESTHARAGIDRRAALELARDGELRTDTLVLQAQYGRGRGSEEDRANIDRRLGTLSDAELAQLRDVDYPRLVESLGMTQSSALQRVRQALHNGQYIGIDPQARISAWASTQLLDSVSGPTGDLVVDLRGTGSARQHRLWSYLLTHGRADTPAERLAQHDHMLAGMGAEPREGSLEAWLEGYEGYVARRHGRTLHAQYAQLRADGTANLTEAQARQRIEEQVRTGRITSEEGTARLQRYGAIATTADRARAAQDASVQGRTQSLRTFAVGAGVVVSVVAGIAISVASGGTLTGPYIAAISSAAGGLTTMGISAATLGADYDRRDVMFDAASIIVGAVADRLIPARAIGRFANRMLARGFTQAQTREILSEAIVTWGSSSAGSFAETLLDERTYQGSPEQVRRRLLQGARGAVIGGAVEAVVDRAGGSLNAALDRRRGRQGLPVDDDALPMVSAPARRRPVDQSGLAVDDAFDADTARDVQADQVLELTSDGGRPAPAAMKADVERRLGVQLADGAADVRPWTAAEIEAAEQAVRAARATPVYGPVRPPTLEGGFAPTSVRNLSDRFMEVQWANGATQVMRRDLADPWLVALAGGMTMEELRIIRAALARDPSALAPRILGGSGGPGGLRMGPARPASAAQDVFDGRAWAAVEGLELTALERELLRRYNQILLQDVRAGATLRKVIGRADQPNIGNYLSGQTISRDTGEVIEQNALYGDVALARDTAGMSASTTTRQLGLDYDLAPDAQAIGAQGGYSSIVSRAPRANLDAIDGRGSVVVSRLARQRLIYIDTELTADQADNLGVILSDDIAAGMGGTPVSPRPVGGRSNPYTGTGITSGREIVDDVGRRVRPELGQELRTVNGSGIQLQEGARMMRRTDTGPDQLIATYRGGQWVINPNLPPRLRRYFEGQRDASLARAARARAAKATPP